MKKEEFVKKLQDKVEHNTGHRPSFVKAKDMLDAVIGTMEDSLLNGKSFRFRGFGRFEFRKREGFKRRTYVKGGEKVEGGYMTDVPNRVVAYFNPSDKLNDKLTRRLSPVLFEDSEES